MHYYYGKIHKSDSNGLICFGMIDAEYLLDLVNSPDESYIKKSASSCSNGETYNYAGNHK